MTNQKILVNTFLPPLKSRKLGFSQTRQKGSHAFFYKNVDMVRQAHQKWWTREGSDF